MTTATRIIFSPVVSSNPARTIINQFTLRSKIKKILKDHTIDGASITKNTGIWKGDFENSFTLYLIGITKATGKSLASKIKKLFNQDSVILETVKQDIKFI